MCENDCNTTGGFGPGVTPPQSECTVSMAEMARIKNKKISARVIPLVRYMLICMRNHLKNMVIVSLLIADSNKGVPGCIWRTL